MNQRKKYKFQYCDGLQLKWRGANAFRSGANVQTGGGIQVNRFVAIYSVWNKNKNLKIYSTTLIFMILIS